MRGVVWCDSSVGMYCCGRVRMRVCVCVQVRAGLPRQVVIRHIVPACGFAVCLGSSAYFLQARAMSEKERRSDVTAQPHGACRGMVLRDVV